MEFSIYTIFMLISAVLVLSIDLIIYMGSNNKASKLFLVLSFVSAIWIISQIYLVTTYNPNTANILIRSQYIMGIIITCGFYIFSKVYPFNNKISKLTYFSLYLIVILITYLYTFTDLLMTGVKFVGGHGHWSWQFGIFHPLFDLIFSFIWFISLYNIFKSFKKASSVLKINMGHMFWGLTLGIIPPSLANIILPTIGIYSLNWTGPIFSAIWVFVIGYSIMQYRQMNVKVAITEMLAVAMTTIFFLNIFIKAEFGTLENLATFLVFLVIAIYLIKTVLSEAKFKEELRQLNSTLEDKVNEQTSEIRKSYQAEKSARRELEKLNDTKNQFILITQHSIRTPLQHLKYGLENITSKNSSNNNDELSSRETVNVNINRLMSITNDFLNITTIDSNKKLLNCERFDTLTLIDKAIHDLQFEIDQKNLNVDVDRNPPSWPKIVGDKNKVYECLVIIIENAIKYNKQNGQISISAISSEDKIQIFVNDSGIGISKDDQNKINNTHFFRGEEAKVQNPIGMGIGLSVARAIARAHHGDLNIYSAGMNHGTNVTINLPTNYLKLASEMI